MLPSPSRESQSVQKGEARRHVRKKAGTKEGEKKVSNSFSYNAVLTQGSPLKGQVFD